MTTFEAVTIFATGTQKKYLFNISFKSVKNDIQINPNSMIQLTVLKIVDRIICHHARK